MKDPFDEYGFETFEQNEFPVAYLLTFRTYGTWVHGDERGSVERGRNDDRRVIRTDENVPLKERMRAEMKYDPVLFSVSQRSIVEKAIIEVCEYRNYMLRAHNIRTNHVHAVISKSLKPEKIVNDLKTYSTRKLREEKEFDQLSKVWARGASTRYLWKPKHVDAAVDYVLFGQGDVALDKLLKLL